MLRLSTSAYFLSVGLLTALGLGIVMAYRPPFAHSICSLLGLERLASAAPDSFYLVRVAPLFEIHCTGCHGARRRKASLRLDSFASTMNGGKHGPVIVAGDWKESELIKRLLLPPDNDRAMPPSGKPSLSADEVTVVRLWIAAGASSTLPVAGIKGAPPPVPKIEFPEINAAAVIQARAPVAHVVTELQARLPGVLLYESRISADLELDASLLGRAFGDREFSALAPVLDHIVWADLSGTSISDASAQSLATCKRLRALRLANTAVTDSTARALTSLPALKSLTVLETTVTESSLAALRSKGVKIYDGRDTVSASNTIS